MQMQPSRIDVWKMFDRIAPRYDLLNRILSLGLDGSWRQRVGKYLPEEKNLKVLDLATGTGDLLLALFSENGNIASAVGLDMSAKMLTIAEKKIAKSGLRDSINFVRADVAQIPFPENSFNVATMAFGIRNVPDIDITLKQMQRVLKPSGRAVVLEFSVPEKFVMRKLFLLYLKTFVPVVGAIISGDYKSCQYLNKTVETFLNREELCQAMRNAGFINVNFVSMTFGVACIYYGDKPA
jgi:demethylmenaquinone methyltransferase/2-methoxy-6-polyprenyl-1,4-benzoquinol methylase